MDEGRSRAQMTMAKLGNRTENWLDSGYRGLSPYTVTLKIPESTTPSILWFQKFAGSL